MLDRIKATTVLKDPAREKKSLEELLFQETGENNDTFRFRSEYTMKTSKIADVRPTTAILLGHLATNRVLLGTQYDSKLTEALDYVDEFINKP